MQRLFAVCTKSIVPSVRAIGATNAVAIAKPLSFMQRSELFVSGHRSCAPRAESGNATSDLGNDGLLPVSV